MSAIASTSINADAKNAPAPGRLFFLNLSAGRILSANPDGSDLKAIVNEGRKLPDGLALDVVAGHIYWTNMGNPSRNDGSIMRSDLDGKNMMIIVPPGHTFTPKQLHLEKRAVLEADPSLRLVPCSGVHGASRVFAESFLPGSHIVVLGLLSLHVLREATSTLGPDVIVEPRVPTAPKAEDLADKRFLTGRRTQWNLKH